MCSSTSIEMTNESESYNGYFDSNWLVLSLRKRSHANRKSKMNENMDEVTMAKQPQTTNRRLAT